jgi:hypothetical protein
MLLPASTRWLLAVFLSYLPTLSTLFLAEGRVPVSVKGGTRSYGAELKLH